MLSIMKTLKHSEELCAVGYGVAGAFAAVCFLSGRCQWVCGFVVCLVRLDWVIGGGVEVGEVFHGLYFGQEGKGKEKGEMPDIHNRHCVSCVSNQRHLSISIRPFYYRPVFELDLYDLGPLGDVLDYASQSGLEGFC